VSIIDIFKRLFNLFIFEKNGNRKRAKINNNKKKKKNNKNSLKHLEKKKIKKKKKKTLLTHGNLIVG
jgi:hypothetical protein